MTDGLKFRNCRVVRMISKIIPLQVLLLLILLQQSDGAGGFFWSGKSSGATSDSFEMKSAPSKATGSQTNGKSKRDDIGEKKTISFGPKLMPSISDIDDSHLYISEVITAQLSNKARFF